MWVFVAEAIGALSLLLFIVWWTLGPTHRREQDEVRKLAADEARASNGASKADGAGER